MLHGVLDEKLAPTASLHGVLVDVFGIGLLLIGKSGIEKSQDRVLRGLENVRRDFDALSPPDPLTKREIEILRLMAGGYSNREIAAALGTAEGTITVPRRAGGMPSMMAMGALKRRVSNVVFARMLADQKRREAGPGGQRGTTADSSVTGPDPRTPVLRTSHVPDPPLHSLNAHLSGALT